LDGQERGRRDAGPETRARYQIDAALTAAGWFVQDRTEVNLTAGPGVAVREAPTATGPADYLLFLDGRACGVLEAKPDGTTLLGVVNQGTDYTRAAPAIYPAWANPLPFIYVSTGAETLFQDARDLLARPRRVFAPHRPETLRAMLGAGSSLRARLPTLPPLDSARLRPCQAEAIAGVEVSLAQGKPRALVSMATGAGGSFDSDRREAFVDLARRRRSSPLLQCRVCKPPFEAVIAARRVCQRDPQVQGARYHQTIAPTRSACAPSGSVRCDAARSSAQKFTRNSSKG
jgi:hypothetical protein